MIGAEERERRFWAKVNKNGPRSEYRPDLGACWLWTASLNSHGYGQFAVAPGIPKGAYVVAYELVIGAVPEGLELDHLCRVLICVNPSHLEAVTHAENLRRAPLSVSTANAAKTQCPQGHPYDEANTYLPKRGGRMCRTCNRERARTG